MRVIHSFRKMSCYHKASWFNTGSFPTSFSPRHLTPNHFILLRQAKFSLHTNFYQSNLEGFSMFALNVSNHVAANSSPIIRRSQDSVTVITLCIVSSAVTTGRVPPTAIIQACGGLITAENSVIPNIPRLEIVKEPP